LGVMIAIGMQRSKLAVILLIETFLIGLVGAVAGILGSIPVINYYFHHPIQLTGDAAKTMTDMGIEPYMYFSRDLFVYYNQALTVFIITLVIALYPIYKAFTLKLNLSLKA
jgi:ABC-type antimicrobial peptide transport system permease subunit